MMTILERARRNRVNALRTLSERKRPTHAIGKTAAGIDHMRPMLLSVHTTKTATASNHLRMAA